MEFQKIFRLVYTNSYVHLEVLIVAENIADATSKFQRYTYDNELVVREIESVTHVSSRVIV